MAAFNSLSRARYALYTANMRATLMNADIFGV